MQTQCAIDDENALRSLRATNASEVIDVLPLCGNLRRENARRGGRVREGAVYDFSFHIIVGHGEVVVGDAQAEATEAFLMTLWNEERMCDVARAGQFVGLLKKPILIPIEIEEDASFGIFGSNATPSFGIAPRCATSWWCWPKRELSTS